MLAFSMKASLAQVNNIRPLYENVCVGRLSGLEPNQFRVLGGEANELALVVEIKWFYISITNGMRLAFS